MSIKAYAWAKSVKVGSPTLKAVLCAIADYADDKGRAWPSLDRIAEDTEFSARAVRMAVAELAEKGLLTRQERLRPDGGRSTDILTLQTHLSAPQERGAHPLASTATPLATDAPPPATAARPPSRTCAPRTTTELPSNGSEAKASGSADAAPPELSLVDRMWLECVAMLVGAGVPDKQARQMIGRWHRDTRDPGQVTWAVQAAVDAGTGDPIPYVTRLLSERRPGNVTSFSAYPAGRSRPAKDDHIAAAMAEFSGGGCQRPGFEPGDDGWRRPDETGSDAAGSHDADGRAKIAYLRAHH